MEPCYCGGCDACLRDQGYDPDAIECGKCGEWMYPGDDTWDHDCNDEEERGALREVNAECAEYDGEDE